MLRPLWRDTTDRLADLAPTGSVAPGILGGHLAQALSGASKMIGEPQRGQ